MLDDDSFNNPSSGMINTTYQQQPHISNDIGSKMSNYSTVSNTNIMNHQSIIKGQNNVIVNVNNKKKSLQTNNSKGNIAGATITSNTNIANVPKGGSNNKGRGVKK